jgi:NAD(P)H dehydrogenase (quinone)
VTGDVERLGGRPPKPLRDVLAGALKSPSAGRLAPEPIS